MANFNLLNAPSFDVLTSSSFPSLADFSAAMPQQRLIKWTDLKQGVVYQIESTRTVNTQHGQSVILSLQKAAGTRCSEWACGMLTKELLQNPILMLTSRLFIRPTGSKMSKIGMMYNSRMERCTIQDWNGVQFKIGMVYNSRLEWCTIQDWNGVQFKIGMVYN